MVASGNTLLHTDYGKSSKELIEFVGQLRALGAHIDLELPRIVVIGNQSAGKSSLVEAISGISVPRDAGTCTRCPMECRLSHTAGEWSCQIKIRWEYADDNKQRLDEVEEIEFGPRLFNKGDVELMLRRAQAAVLNPQSPISTFLSMAEADLRAGVKVLGKKPLAFSRNVVCIELDGPELADLSFVDLPGIVQNADAEIVQLVEELVNSYIHGNSLILVTLPMSDDIENQKAARLAKLADPNGLRTIGVMTKPDTLTAGSTKAREMWLEVLEGRRHPLLHGYYCTRQPDDDERTRGITGSDARAAEDTFFKTTVPWATSSHQHRFGTTNLVQNISKLLTQIIRESLPALLGQVASHLESCNGQLEKLPPAITTDPPAFVLQLVTSFCNDLALRVRGSPTNTALVQGTRKTYESFKFSVRSSAPPFVPYENVFHAPKDINEYLRVDDKGRGSFPPAKTVGAVMYLEDVRKHIRTSITRELPGNIPYAAKVSLIQSYQRNWESSAVGCFDEVQKMFKGVVSELILEHFGRYGNLKAVVNPVTLELINRCSESALTSIRQILQLETSPFTQNDHYLSTCRDNWLAKYKDARAGHGPAERVTPAITAPPAAAAPFSFQQMPTPTLFSGVSFKPTTPSTAKEGTKAPEGGGASTAKATQPTSATPAPAQPQAGSSESEVPGIGLQSTGAAPAATSAFQSLRATPAPFASFAAGPFQSLSLSQSQSQSQTPSLLSKSAGDVRREMMQDVLATLTKLGYKGVTEDDLGKLNPPDKYEEELEVMAEVRAYFQVSYKRVIDMVPLSIDHHFLYAFVNALQQLLYERLGLGTANSAARCSSYVAEDPNVVASRDELLTKKKRLENVQKALFGFGL